MYVCILCIRGPEEAVTLSFFFSLFLMVKGGTRIFFLLNHRMSLPFYFILASDLKICKLEVILCHFTIVIYKHDILFLEGLFTCFTIYLLSGQ